MAEDKKKPAKKAKKSRKTAPGKGKKPDSTQAKDGSRAKKQDLPIVAIGASAGGLDAFKRFFSTVPADSNMAFVLIQHLDPSHESLMVDLLSRQVEMKVLQAENGMPVQANHVYVIPPNKYMNIKDGKLELLDPVERRGMRMPIDFFFRGLAEDRREKAICIILSGTGSDGTLGLRAIKEFGGMGMVQDPTQAAYDGMPRSAINTGVVDYIRQAEDLAEDLIKYVSHSYMRNSLEANLLTDGPPDHFNKILALLRTRTNYDFRYYKKNTLIRRIERRMSLCSTEDLEAYLSYLRENQDELKLLFKDLLISVTRFFRDTEAMETLQKDVIPEIIGSLAPDQPIRVWIPGCATGEEAYSIAIMLIEECLAANISPNIQIFATDIDEDALDVARTGVYLNTIEADVSAERIKRFFIKEDQSYRVNKQLRESVVFAVQNLITDPPFSKLNLITCRNVLIYLENEAQGKIMDIFHLSLKDKGFMFLGPSETIGRKRDMFRQVSKQYRIYQRIGPTRHVNVEFPVGTRGYEAKTASPRTTTAEKLRFSPEEITRNLLLSQFAPASVLINNDNIIEYFFGETENYLAQPTGEPTRDIYQLCRHGLRTKLRAAVYKARQDQQPVVFDDVKVLHENSYHATILSVIPVDANESGNLLICFEKGPDEIIHAESKEKLSLSEDNAIKHLEYELHTTREELQSTIEEMETSNEELKASNEEVMSMNEELQSTNEELETSKEELQSLNEELTTVNNELLEKVSELETSNNDFVNLLTSTEVATIFLDTNLKIKRYTPSVTRMLNVIPTDINRPITDVSRNINDPQLIDDVHKVLDKLASIEKEVSDDKDGWFIRRVLPYRTQENKIEGVVVTFSDITQIKNAQIELEKSQKTLSEAQRIAKMGSWEWDIITDELEWTDEVYRIFGTNHRSFKETYADFLSFIHPEDKAFVQESVDKALKEKVPYSIDHRIVLPNGEEKVVHEDGRAFFDDDGNAVRMVGTVLDITERSEVEKKLQILNETLEDKINERTEELRKSEALFRSVINHADVEVLLKDIDGRFMLVNDYFLREHGLKESDVIGKTLGEIYSKDIEAPFRRIEEKVINTKSAQHDEILAIRAGERQKELLVAKFPIFDDQKNIIAIGAINTDISELKSAIDKLDQARNEADQANKAKSRFLASMSHELRTPLNAILGFGQILELDGSLKNESSEEAVKYILESGDHLLQLINQVLDLSGIESDSLTLEVNTLTADDILQPCLSMAHILAEKKEISISNECKCGNEIILADLTRTKQVLLNFLSNAVKYNNRHGEISVKCETRKDENIMHFSVTDTGIGISETDQKKIFTPFNRLVNPTTPDEEGTGIGLTISKQLIDKMGGRIGFSSESGKGSTFWFELPLADDKKSSKAIKDTSHKIARNDEATLPEGTVILSIEDNLANQKLLEAMVDRIKGAAIVIVGSAEEGIETCKELSPSVILMDIHLPGMNGLEATQLLKEDPETSDIPILVVSADALPEHIENARKLDIEGYITKPIDFNQLLSMLKDILA